MILAVFLCCVFQFDFYANICVCNQFSIFKWSSQLTSQFKLFSLQLTNKPRLKWNLECSMLELPVYGAAVQCWKWKLLTHFMNYNINAELMHNTSCNWIIHHENFMMKVDSVWNVLGHHHRYGVRKFEILALVITKYLVSMYVLNFFVCHNPYYMYMCV